MRQLLALALFVFIFSASPAFSGERDADHEALRGIMKTSSEALNAGDFDKLAPVLSSKNLTVVTVDNQKFKNLADFKAYWEKTFTGPTAVLKSVKVEPTADAASEFIGENVGIADGTSKETYTFRDGDVRDMTTRWTAVLEKEEGNWKISQIHFSANILDNPVLSAAQRAAGGNIFLPAGIGFALGALIIGLLGRKKTA